MMMMMEPVVIRFGKKKIKCESCVKFLDIMLDANLSWKYHIAELSKKLSRSIEIFYKIGHLVLFVILFFHFLWNSYEGLCKRTKPMYKKFFFSKKL